MMKSSALSRRERGELMILSNSAKRADPIQNDITSPLTDLQRDGLRFAAKKFS
jgi:hypothetical protein